MYKNFNVLILLICTCIFTSCLNNGIDKEKLIQKVTKQQYVFIKISEFIESLNLKYSSIGTIYNLKKDSLEMFTLKNYDLLFDLKLKGILTPEYFMDPSGTTQFDYSSVDSKLNAYIDLKTKIGKFDYPYYLEINTPKQIKDLYRQLHLSGAQRTHTINGIVYRFHSFDKEWNADLSNGWVKMVTLSYFPSKWTSLDTLNMNSSTEPENWTEIINEKIILRCEKLYP